jgi:hypothetical protein
MAPYALQSVFYMQQCIKYRIIKIAIPAGIDKRFSEIAFSEIALRKYTVTGNWQSIREGRVSGSLCIIFL